MLSLLFKLLLPELPFIDRVGLVFILCMVLPIVTVFIEKAGEHDNAVQLGDINFTTTSSFNIATVGIVLILTALYVTWW